MHIDSDLFTDEAVDDTTWSFFTALKEQLLELPKILELQGNSFERHAQHTFDAFPIPIAFDARRRMHRLVEKRVAT